MDQNGSDKPTSTTKTPQLNGRDFNLLGMTQIIITAATPVVEDGSDKSFPPIGEREEGNKDDSTESGNQEGERPSSSSTRADNGVKPVAGENKQTDNKSKIIEGRQQAREAQIVTRTINSPKPNPEDSPSSDQDSSEVQPLEEADDPFKENSNPANAEASAGFEANFEANFDANFDDAFASSGSRSQSVDDEAKQDDVDIGAPKQVVGGRASIPEELDSNQLERLQNLKESNA